LFSSGLAQPGRGCRGVTPLPPIIRNSYYFSHLKDRNIKIQQESANSFPKDAEVCINLVERKNAENKNC
jgi:hypothetical protein